MSAVANSQSGFRKLVVMQVETGRSEIKEMSVIRTVIQLFAQPPRTAWMGSIKDVTSLVYFLDYNLLTFLISFKI